MTPPSPSRRRLATVLFTDIVGSTERVSELGDAAWAATLQRHHQIVRAELEQFGGREVATTGDGFLAVFEAPAQAVHCAVAIREAVATLGIVVRAGIHTGEIEESDGDVGGIAVHIAARVLDAAGAGEVLVSRTVKDVVGGANIRLEPFGTRELKGVPGHWQLYAVRSERVDRPERRARVPALWLLRHRRLASVAAVVAAAVGILVLGVYPRGGPPRAAGGETEFMSIAVLPFLNMSGDPANEYFSDGVTENILTELTRVGDLRVISRTSVMQYKGVKRPLREIAEELGVATILEGSVQRSGDRVRISAQLIDAQTDEHLWAETYDRDLMDIFGVQTEIALEIARAMKATLSDEEESRLAVERTVDPEAYDFYLRGREYYYRYQPDAMDEAIQLFQKAIATDPEFALAHAGLADAYAQRAGPDPKSAWHDSAMASAERALALDPNLAEAHKAIGLVHVYRGKPRECVEANRRALSLNPGYSPAVNNLGSCLMSLGRPDEALPLFERARRIDPNRGTISLTNLAYAQYLLGMDDRAEATLRRLRELFPDSPRGDLGLANLEIARGRPDRGVEYVRQAIELAGGKGDELREAGVLLVYAGDVAEARAVLEEGLAMGRGSESGWFGEIDLAYVLRRQGEPARANALLDAVREALSEAVTLGMEANHAHYALARVAGLRGESEVALEHLEASFRAGGLDIRMARIDPALESVRSDPRFDRLARQVDARAAELRRRVEAREATARTR